MAIILCGDGHQLTPEGKLPWEVPVWTTMQVFNLSRQYRQGSSATLREVLGAARSGNWTTAAQRMLVERRTTLARVLDQLKEPRRGSGLLPVVLCSRRKHTPKATYSTDNINRLALATLPGRQHSYQARYCLADGTTPASLPSASRGVAASTSAAAVPASGSAPTGSGASAVAAAAGAQGSQAGPGAASVPAARGSRRRTPTPASRRATILAAFRPAQVVLQLKVGAMVMLNANVDRDAGLVNGVRGVVRRFQHAEGEVEPLPVVQWQAVDGTLLPYVARCLAA